jgi:KAP family P-loop domain/Sulfatase-modifying factor enzyme 1
LELGVEIQPIVDDPCRSDQLGRGEAVDALVHLIRAIDQKASSSFTIGIFGDWGTGKTSMLRQIQAKLEEDREGPPLIVWFNPWQFSSKDNILASLFISVADAIERQIDADKGFLDKGSAKVKGFASRLKDVATAFIARGELEVSVPFVASIKYSGASAHDALKKSDASTTPMAELKDTYSSLYFDVLSAISASADGLSRKIVVLIDDLDRCDQENIVTLFDGMKVFFDIPNFVFVVGAARDVVRAALRRKVTALGAHEEVVDELSYLDKIIQFGYVIPPPDARLLKESIVEPVLNKYKIDASYSNLILDIMETNPRTLKRMLNHFIFTHFVLQKRLGETTVAELVLKAAIISYKYPRFFSAIQRHANTLVEFEKRVKESQAGLSITDPFQIIATDNSAISETINNKTAFDLQKIISFRMSEKNFGQLANVEEYFFGSSIIGAADFIDGRIDNRVGDEVRSPMEGFVDRFIKVAPITETIGNERYGQFMHTSTSALNVDKFPMTSEIYCELMPETRLKPMPGFPVTEVSWRDAALFCNKLSERYGLDPAYTNVGGQPEIAYDKSGFRLLTEAEWESIARSGMTKNPNLEDIAWFSSNSSGGVHSTGTKPANAYGMYDILGNVWEWVNDWSGKYPQGKQTDWRGPSSGWEKIARGGSWANFAKAVAPDYRTQFDIDKRSDNIGFRICTRTNLGRDR